MEAAIKKTEGAGNNTKVISVCTYMRFSAAFHQLIRSGMSLSIQIKLTKEIQDLYDLLWEAFGILQAKRMQMRSSIIGVPRLEYSRKFKEIYFELYQLSKIITPFFEKHIDVIDEYKYANLAESFKLFHDTCWKLLNNGDTNVNTKLL